MRTYDESLKIYRDNYSLIETGKHAGWGEGPREGVNEKALRIARKLKKEGDATEKLPG